MTKLSALFAIFAVFGLLIAMLGHAARANSPAPSMVRNDLSPIGYIIFVICTLIALASAAPAKAGDCPPWWQCSPQGDWNHPSCKKCYR
ncbi:hypothetical protein H8A97_12985 [Bradyrhizobium sp. Arg62]|uniref:hypothetical protein n=1 Tax=Bradyrhizobium brasilense TaxID=1419277 RepID=UPI001E3D624A|nr:hypothetical protein [Bradyrhizobium brasilense]MCC8945988.1 hypothetical protein [Bradyrhizobium brasilense]